MVIQVLDDGTDPGRKVHPPRFMVVQLPEVTPMFALDDWTEPKYSSGLNEIGQPIKRDRRTRRLDIPKFLNGRELSANERVQASLTDMNDNVIEVTSDTFADADGKKRVWSR
jgi:hypothetical protein